MRYVRVPCLAITLVIAAATAFAQKSDVIVITGAEKTVLDAWSAAAALAKKAPGGAMRHVVLEDTILESGSALSERLASLVSAHKARAVVVHGSNAALGFRNLRQVSPDLILISVCPEGPSLDIEAAASLVLDVDWIGRAAGLARRAAQYGVKEIVFYPDSKPEGSDGRRAFKQVLMAAAADSAISFIEFPEKTDKAAFLTSRLVAAGGKVLLWAGNGKERVPLLKALASGGGYYLEQASPSIRIDYPEILGFSAALNAGGHSQLVKIAEKNAIEMGAAGKYGVWQYPADWVLLRTAISLAQDALARKIRVTDPDLIREKAAAETGGVKFKFEPQPDPDTLVPSRNHFLFTEDLYVLGRGILPAAKVEVPPKYYALAKPDKR